MKKIYLLFGALALTSFSFGQARHAAASGVNVVLEKFSNLSGRVMVPGDTLYPATFDSSCFTSDPAPLTYYTTAAGYVSGINEYGDLQKAQVYRVTGPVSVTAVLALFPIVVNTSNSTVEAKLYNVDPTAGLPTTSSLQTSNGVLMANITANTLTRFDFPTPQVVADTFAASIFLPTGTGDTVAVASTKDGCVAFDSLSIEMWSDASWHFFGDPGNWDLHQDLAIFPVLDIPAGLNNSVSKSGLTMFAGFPNPANNNFSVNFSLANSSKVSIETYDVAGKKIATVTESNFSSGMHSESVDLSSYSAGSYLYSISMGGTKLFGKFMVVK